jgi:hypothetical protein
MSPTQDRRPQDDHKAGPASTPARIVKMAGNSGTPPVDCASGIAASVVTDFGPGCLGQAGRGSVRVHETVEM